jgi:methyltransferase
MFMSTRLFFFGIIALFVFQRIIEIRFSKRNAVQILNVGGQEHGDNFLPLVKAMQIFWWISMIAEVCVLDRPFVPILAAVGLSGAILGQTLRYLSMQALDWRWTLPIMTVPNSPLIDSGIYAYLRHPNWLGVCIEIGTLPLIHSAYLTAILFSIVNAVLMYKRIQLEEIALQQQSGIW